MNPRLSSTKSCSTVVELLVAIKWLNGCRIVLLLMSRLVEGYCLLVVLPENQPSSERYSNSRSSCAELPLKKMRPAGDIDYEDERLHPNTLLFLKDLKANNKRPWLKCGHEDSSRINLEAD